MTTTLLPAITNRKITFADALDLLQQVIDECGSDYYYSLKAPRLYVKNNEPACLVARALAKAGVSIEAMQSWDSCQARVGWILYDEYFTRGAITAFTVAQDCQDKGQTWGLCLERAKSIRAGRND